jgi:AcrR family transcriptional regulator
MSVDRTPGPDYRLNMRSKRVFNAPDSPTRDAIAQAAARLFAEHGVEHTTVRQIVEDAGISLGAVNFHFGSKLGLAYEVFDRLAWEVCDARHAEYDALEKAAADGPVAVDAIFRALLRPYVEGDEQRRLLVIYILQQMRLAKLDLAREVGARHFDGIAARTVVMLSKAAPHLSEHEVWWRYNLALGAVISIVSDSRPDNRLKRLSKGVADAADRATLIEQTIAFVVRGFAGTQDATSATPAPVATATPRARTGRRKTLHA